ncbi:MAG: hypothetical protein AAB337_03120 [Patescibacteria group bacterium]
MRLISYCPLCQSEFHPMEAQLLGERGERHLVHVRCVHCHNAILALVLVTKVGVSSVGLVTDLTYDDVLKFRASRRISVDDVLSVHEELEIGSLLTLLTHSG